MHILSAGMVQLTKHQGLQSRYHQQLTALSVSDNDGWRLTFAGGGETRHATVVLANGYSLSALAPTALLSLYLLRGQVSHLLSTAPVL